MCCNRSAAVALEVENVEFEMFTADALFTTTGPEPENVEPEIVKGIAMPPIANAPTAVPA